MRLAFQLLNYLERSIFLELISKRYYQQLRQRHRQTKLETVPKEKSKCLEPKPPKKSFWSIFRSKPDPKCFEKEKKKVRECETVERLVPEDQAECDLANISQMGGTAYRTCGPAYVLQKDMIEQLEIKPESEEKILKDMMKDPTLKGQCDPMPPFESVEKRLIDLSERKLHPSYKILMTIPKRPQTGACKPPTTPYKMRSGPVSPDEIPEHLRINKETFDKKNILYEFKKAQPPQQLLSRLVEMRRNERPTMQKKIEAKKREKDCSK